MRDRSIAIFSPGGYLPLGSPRVMRLREINLLPCDFFYNRARQTRFVIKNLLDSSKLRVRIHTFTSKLDNCDNRETVFHSNAKELNGIYFHRLPCRRKRRRLAKVNLMEIKGLIFSYRSPLSAEANGIPVRFRAAIFCRLSPRLEK